MAWARSTRICRRSSVIAPQLPYAGGQVCGNDFLPAYHQGARVVPGNEPIANLNRRTQAAEACRNWNSAWPRLQQATSAAARGNDAELAARIRIVRDGVSHAVASARGVRLLAGNGRDASAVRSEARRDRRLRLAVPRRPATGRARRAVRRTDRRQFERQLGSHGDMAEHAPLAKAIDQPIAGLLKDLKRRGMLDETLVVWTTEFGRTPGVGRAQRARASRRVLFFVAGGRRR